MKHTHFGRSRHIMSHEKRVHAAPDYFSEALRILDNDITLKPQRKHLEALWGLVIGLSRRLTQAVVECQDNRPAAIRKTITDENWRKNHKKHTGGKIASTASLDAEGLGGAAQR